MLSSASVLQFALPSVDLARHSASQLGYSPVMLITQSSFPIQCPSACAMLIPTASHWPLAPSCSPHLRRHSSLLVHQLTSLHQLRSPFSALRMLRPHSSAADHRVPSSKQFSSPVQHSSCPLASGTCKLAPSRRPLFSPSKPAPPQTAHICVPLERSGSTLP